MADTTYINLWEAMTNLESRNSRGEHTTPKVTEDNMMALGQSARWGGQELAIQVTEEGWLIKIFSCYSDDNTGIEILIPKKHLEPVKVVKDIDGHWEYHH